MKQFAVAAEKKPFASYAGAEQKRTWTYLTHFLPIVFVH